MCTPEWRDEDWWRELEEMTPHMIQLPPRTRLYFGAYRQAPLPQKWWRSVVWLIDTTNHKRRNTKKGKSETVPNPERSLKNREDLIQELRNLRDQQYTDLARRWAETEVLSSSPQDCRETASSAPISPTDREVRIRGGVKAFNQEKSQTKPLPELETHLRVPITLAMNGEGICQAEALIDTGAEVCLVKTGLLPDDAFRVAERPLRLVMANNQRLKGGKREATVELRFEATDVEGKTKIMVITPTNLYEADIEEDVILSYQWLGEREFEVNARRHGLAISGAQRRIWISGI